MAVPSKFLYQKQLQEMQKSGAYSEQQKQEYINQLKAKNAREAMDAIDNKIRELEQEYYNPNTVKTRKEVARLEIQQLQQMRSLAASGEYTPESLVRVAITRGRGKYDAKPAFKDTTLPWLRDFKTDVPRYAPPGIPGTSSPSPLIKDFNKDFIPPTIPRYVPPKDEPPIKFSDVNFLRTFEGWKTRITTPPITDINPVTGKPYGTVTPAPTTKERWEKATEGQKYLGGSLQFLSEEIGEVYEKSEQKKMKIPGYVPYQMDATKNLIKTSATLAPLTIPVVGEALFVGIGVEHLAAPGGRKEISEIGSVLEENYGIPKEMAWALPIGEIGLGSSRILFPKVKGFISTKGRIEVNPENIVPKDVLLGKKVFPEAGTKGMPISKRAKLHKELFEKGEFKLPDSDYPMGYHATPEKWEKLITTAGTSELKGSYLSYGISPHFLKLPSEKAGKSFIERMYGDILSPAGAKPGVMAIRPTKFKLGKKGEIGEAFVPGIKTEVEAIIPPETKLKEIARRYYFKWKGRRIPIDEFSTIKEKKTVDIINPESIKFEDISSSYSGYGGAYRDSTKFLRSTMSSASKTSKSSYKQLSSISKLTSLTKLSNVKSSLSKISLKKSITKSGISNFDLPISKSFFKSTYGSEYPMIKPLPKPPKKGKSTYFWFKLPKGKDIINQRPLKLPKQPLAYQPSLPPTLELMGIKPIRGTPPKRIWTGLETRPFYIPKGVKKITFMGGIPISQVLGKPKKIKKKRKRRKK